MYDHQQARQFLLTNEFAISIIANVPHIDVSQLVCIEPPGVLYQLDDVMQFFRRIGKRLESLCPHPKGSFCVAISSDLRTVVLARTPSPQLTMDLGDNGLGDDPLSLQHLAHTETERAAEAIKHALEIAAAQVRGELSNAEDLATLLSHTPSPDIVRRALKELGREPLMISIDNQDVLTGGSESFPAKLASRTVYEASMSIEGGVNERDQITRVHILTCDPQDEHAIAAKSCRTDILVDYIEPHDGKLLIAAQLSGSRVLADISITIDSYSGRATAITLLKIKNSSVIFASLRLQVAQDAFSF